MILRAARYCGVITFPTGASPCDTAALGLLAPVGDDFGFGLPCSAFAEAGCVGLAVAEELAVPLICAGAAAASANAAILADANLIMRLSPTRTMPAWRAMFRLA